MKIFGPKILNFFWVSKPNLSLCHDRSARKQILICSSYSPCVVVGGVRQKDLGLDYAMVDKHSSRSWKFSKNRHFFDLSTFGLSLRGAISKQKNKRFLDFDLVLAYKFWEDKVWSVALSQRTIFSTLWEKSGRKSTKTFAFRLRLRFTAKGDNFVYFINLCFFKSLKWFEFLYFFKA